MWEEVEENHHIPDKLGWHCDQDKIEDVLAVLLLFAMILSFFSVWDGQFINKWYPNIFKKIIYKRLISPLLKRHKVFLVFVFRTYP